MQTASAPSRTLSISRLLRSPWLHPLNDASAWDALLSSINPLWSQRDFPVRVLQIIDETADTKTFVLKTNRDWPGYRAGQHVVLEVEIDGRRLHRTFSLSSSPSDGKRLSVTIKRQATSRVSGWLHAHCKVGDVLRISAPNGDFYAPELSDAPLLLLSAGSGITPMLSMLRELLGQGHRGRIAFVHSCRTASELIFAETLQRTVAQFPNLELYAHYSASAGRLDAAALSRLHPDFATFQAMVCGPSAFTDTFVELFQRAGVPERIRSESYSGRTFVPSDVPNTQHAVHCSVTKQVFTASSSTGLLEEAEAAGMKPAHGCRIGICKTCQCLKRSGVVKNLRTGVLSAEPNELIQLCVSAAQSPLDIAL